ncbi:hypothetical protein AAVH_26083 [Aphelenchoides avenae]|nr:hypothetical protein AAVH_26083 [Aphelenchus avenae]
MASLALPVPVLGSDGFDGNKSDSHSEDEGYEAEPKKAAFVRCPLCRNSSKEMCESCKKRQNREASRRNREKHARTKAELERMRKKMSILTAQHREDRNFIQTMLLAGVRFCRRCGDDLMNMPTPSTTASNIQYATAQQATSGFGLHHSAMPQTSGQPGPHHGAALSGNAPLANVTFPSSIDDADFFDMEAWLNADDDAYN